MDQPTWDEIARMLEVRRWCSTDMEWDEAKRDAIEATIEAIIAKLSSAVPDPS